MPDYVIRRSARARRARLTITVDAEVVVVLPLRTAARVADELVAAHVDWIGRHLERRRAEVRRLAERPRISDGGALPLHGEPHAVEVQLLPVGRRRTLVEHDDRFTPTVRIAHAQGDERTLPAILEPWLRGEARRELEAAVARLAPTLGVQAARVSVRDQTSRWGSASGKGTLSFSWRLILAPPEILDYVVVHELAHLRERGHTSRFWSLVRSHAPHADEARRWLREHQQELRRALE